MKMPANMARGIQPSACSNGPVIVPSVMSCDVSELLMAITHAKAEVTDALLDDADDGNLMLALVPGAAMDRGQLLRLDHAIAVRDVRRHVLGDAERFGVVRRLRDQAVGCGQAQDAADEDDDAQQGKVPVEARWSLDGEIAGLRHDRGHAARSVEP